MTEQITNPVKAIRAKCLDCCCGSTAEVTNCTVTGCALHPFRFGKNPYRQRRELTEEERQVLRDRLGLIRKNCSNSAGKSATQGDEIDFDYGAED